MTCRRLPQNVALAPSAEIQIFPAPNAQSKYMENRSISQSEHSSPRTGAHLSWRTGAHLSWSTVLREPEHISVGAWFSENRSTSQLEHGSPRTVARFSENQSRVLREPERCSPRTGAHLSWRTGEHLSGEPENISMFFIFSAFSMFSTCSELTPRTPSPAGRLEQFMHP